MSNSQNNEEVKEFVQVVSADNTATEEEIEEATEGIEEEEDTSAQSSEQETEEESEESTDEEDSEEESSDENEEKDKSDGLKDVGGETPKERALRLEVTRLKATLRQHRSGELLVKKTDIETVDTEDEELKQYDPEELKRFEKLALKMGFAKKNELTQYTMQERLDSEFQSFMESHPEYSPEKDTDGILWNQLKEEFSLYQQPKDPKTLKKILNRIHNDIIGVKPITKDITKIKASQEKIKVASYSGATSSKTQTKTPKINPNTSVRTDGLKGFTEEELAELLGE